MSRLDPAPAIQFRLLQALRRLCAIAPSLGEARRRRLRRRAMMLGAVAVLVSLAANVLLVWSLGGLWSGAASAPPAADAPLLVTIPAPAPPLEATSQVEFEAEATTSASASEFAPLPASRGTFGRALEAPRLAGSGDSGPVVDSTGPGGTTFFGVSARGRRIGYVVDVSASMESGGRLWVALAELKRSLAGLPDYAWFFVALFSSEAVIPPFQRSWQRATPEDLARMQRWLDLEVSTGGGTRPAAAFERLFALDPPPDAIFFLTDGEVPPDTPALVRRLNGPGRGTVVNTVAFGTEAGREMLEQIARDSEGIFRFVPVEGGR